MANFEDFRTLQEFAIEAKLRLSPAVWDFLSGGAESETTLLRNRYAIDSIALRPRVLIDVREPDPSTTLLGFNLPTPVVLAPIGSLHLFDPGSAIPSVQAAGRLGTIPIISIMTNPVLEEVAKLTDGPKVFQLYVRGDMDWVDSMCDRVKNAGYDAMAITVDVAHYGRRERDQINRFDRRTHAKRSNLEGIDLDQEFVYRSALTWDFIDHVKDRIGIPIILKGIATAEDAKIAVDHGVEVVYVSNHGGRQLDHGRGAIDVLPEVVAAVDGKAEIVVDGGFLRGSDVLKAMALGANAVAIGKLQGWALAAGGEDALVHAMEIMKQELIVSMGLLGVNRIDELGPQHLHAATPVVAPHVASPYPLFMEKFGD